MWNSDRVLQSIFSPSLTEEETGAREEQFCPRPHSESVAGNLLFFKSPLKSPEAAGRLSSLQVSSGAATLDAKALILSQFHPVGCST